MQRAVVPTLLVCRLKCSRAAAAGAATAGRAKHRLLALALQSPAMRRRVAAFHGAAARIPDCVFSDAFEGCPCDDAVMARLPWTAIREQPESDEHDDDNDGYYDEDWVEPEPNMFGDDANW